MYICQRMIILILIIFIKCVKSIKPLVYYLQVDQEDGFYSTGSMIFSNKNQLFIHKYL